MRECKKPPLIYFNLDVSIKNNGMQVAAVNAVVNFVLERPGITQERN